MRTSQIVGRVLVGLLPCVVLGWGIGVDDLWGRSLVVLLGYAGLMTTVCFLACVLPIRGRWQWSRMKRCRWRPETQSALNRAILDRLLLRLERAGWINYRRRGFSRGGATYHVLELHSIFEPGMEEVIEVKYSQEQKREESGAPPGPEEDEEALGGA